MKIEIPVNGRSIEAYLKVAKSGRGPGVLVLQEWWGLVDHIKDVCNRLSDAGFTALAPDLYRGECAAGPDEAGRLMMALNIEQSAKDLMAAVDHLQSLDSVASEKVGVVGFCMGGQLALFAASLSTKIAAVADFYGIHPEVKPNLSKIEAAVLGVFAEKDGFVPPSAAQKLESDLKAAGVKTDFKIFSGVDHAFFNDTRPEVYNASAAQEAWEKTLSHFRKHLLSKG